MSHRRCVTATDGQNIVAARVKYGRPKQPAASLQVDKRPKLTVGLGRLHFSIGRQIPKVYGAAFRVRRDQTTSVRRKRDRINIAFKRPDCLHLLTLRDVPPAQDAIRTTGDNVFGARYHLHRQDRIGMF